MFVVIVNMRVEPGKLDDFRAALAENAEATRREPGCLRTTLRVDARPRTGGNRWPGT